MEKLKLFPLIKIRTVREYITEKYNNIFSIKKRFHYETFNCKCNPDINLNGRYNINGYSAYVEFGSKKNNTEFKNEINEIFSKDFQKKIYNTVMKIYNNDKKNL